jgi:hypothetical protein
MNLNGVGLANGVFECDQIGWFCDFEAIVDGQFVVGAPATLTTASTALVGHFVRYDTITQQGLIRCGPAKLFESIPARWVDASLRAVMMILGIDSEQQDPGRVVSMLIPAGTRLDACKRIASAINTPYRVLPNGKVFFGESDPIEVDPSLVFDEDHSSGQVSIRGFAMLPMSLAGNQHRVVRAIYDASTDSTRVDFAPESDTLDLLLSSVARRVGDVKIKHGTIEAQNGNFCSVFIDGVSCKRVQVAWGLPGIVATFAPGATVVCCQIDATPYVIGWRTSDITSVTIANGTDSLSLSAPIEQFMRDVVSALDKIKTHTHKVASAEAAASTDLTKMSVVPMPIKSIVRSM